MGVRINTNIGAMTAHMYATKNNVGLDKSLTHLSSGLRVNKAADDAAGLAIANNLRAQAGGLGQAIANANDAIGMIQTADGTLEEYSNILNRIRTLSIQAANDTQDSTTRGYIQTEISRLISSADMIADQTQFNGKPLLSSTQTFTFHIGAYTNEVTTTTVSDTNTAVLLANAPTVGTQASAESVIAMMDSAIKLVDGRRSNLGAAQNQLESTIRNISVTQVNVQAAESQIRDVDFAAESAKFAKHNILAQSGSYAMSQANAVQQNVLRLLQ